MGKLLHRMPYQPDIFLANITIKEVENVWESVGRGRREYFINFYAILYEKCQQQVLQVDIAIAFGIIIPNAHMFIPVIVLYCRLL